jgi:hypothetical protein
MSNKIKDCADCKWRHYSPEYSYPPECTHSMIAKPGSTKYTRNCEFQRSLSSWRIMFSDECGKKGRYWEAKPKEKMRCCGFLRV